MFSYQELDRLSDAEARLALLAPAAQLDVDYEPSTVELILRASAASRTSSGRSVVSVAFLRTQIQADPGRA
jgi:hypothetical protein